MRERWFGSTGRRVPEVAVEGDPAVELDQALVLDGVEDTDALAEAHRSGRPVVVRADSAEAVQRALARPEVALPEGRPELLDLDFRRLTYG
jgi:hypothetical protein